MKTLLAIIFLFSADAFSATKLECSTSDHKIQVEALNPSEIKVTLKGETVFADGIVESGEVDLVARFKSVGEMTLFAKIGKVAPENYLFIQGKRFSVICR